MRREAVVRERFQSASPITMLSVNCLISSFRRSAFCMSGATSTTGPLWRSAISATRVAQAAPVNSPAGALIAGFDRQ